MVEESVFRGVLQFFDRIGVYDVILPFLLIFTLVFAVLEKTKVFGTDKVGKDEYTKKNLNAIVAFSVAFIVVASSRLVAIINKIAANMVVLLVIAIFFLMLAGSFAKERKEGFYLEKGWNVLFMVIMFIGLLIVTLRAIPMKDGTPFLDFVLQYLLTNFNSNAVGSIVLIIVIVGFIALITRSPAKKTEEKKEE